MPDLVRELRQDVLIQGDHPDVTAEWDEGPDRRIRVTVRPVPQVLVQLVHENATGDLNQVVYEGPVAEEHDRQSRLRVEVRHANSIVDLQGVAMTFWSTGIPEQIG